MHAEMAKKRDAEGRLFFSFRTDNPNGKLLPLALDTIRMGRAGSRRLPQQKKANRQRPSGPAPAAAAARHPP